MSMYEYWIGKNVDFRSVWNDFESGLGYIEKYNSMEVHLIRLTFEQYPSDLPLFNHEAVLKTIKGYFHDLKRICLTHQEYSVAGPLFIYDVRRDSGIWSFLGELRQLLLLGTTLADEKIVGQKIDNIDKKLKIISDYFGNSGALYPEDFRQFMEANTPRELENAVQKLFQQKLLRVEISREPFTGNIGKTTESLIELKGLLDGNNYLTRIRILLSTRFSEEELRTLTFDLGIDYDDLPGKGKADKARELVAYLQRRNRIGKLVSLASRIRPDISWVDR